MRGKSEETKRKLKCGQGVLGNYRPWIEVGEFGSVGTCSNPVDWITGRTVHLLSQAEANHWYILRFDQNVTDIREQFPLEKNSTTRIAERLGYSHPKHKDGTPITMTTDMLVTMKDGSFTAYCVKADEKYKNNPRTMEKIKIEQTYWAERKVKFKIVTKVELNKTMANNIRFISMFYNLDKTANYDDISILKHLIARHMISVDLKNSLNYPELVQIHKKEIETWRNQY